MKVDDNSSIIVDDPRGILDEQLRPRPTHQLFVVNYMLNYLITFNQINNLTTIPSEDRNRNLL
jgi:hypothetical protein